MAYSIKDTSYLTLIKDLTPLLNIEIPPKTEIGPDYQFLIDQTVYTGKLYIVRGQVNAEVNILPKIRVLTSKDGSIEKIVRLYHASIYTKNSFFWGKADANNCILTIHRNGLVIEAYKFERNDRTWRVWRFFGKLVDQNVVKLQNNFPADAVIIGSFDVFNQRPIP